ncbi:mitochondrial S-adenosylmethionine carrier protein isoform X4 [Lepidochelys kempii]|uniref:mitochondrial S-adenosylmethionine carrier protein isoform X4 n=1 Tax=Lepidochelys kempii TaxID=8472 RepID=UPI003C6F2831
MDWAGFWVSLTAGGIAGMCVDLILFPLDTIKTRLQSPQGFKKAGGFREIYAGVPSVAVGSFPNAAAFFVTYEFVKSVLATVTPLYLSPVTHMAAASSGEVVACLIRVPSEVVKQRAQVSPSSSTFQVLSNTLYQEIPFSLVQFPVWEALKDLWSWKQGHVVDSWQSATCGAFAGVLHAGLSLSNAGPRIFSALYVLVSWGIVCSHSCLQIKLVTSCPTFSGPGEQLITILFITALNVLEDLSISSAVFFSQD